MRRRLVFLVLLGLGLALIVPRSAQAAPPRVRLVLTQETVDSRAGTPLTVTATVSVETDTGLVPAREWAVEFADADGQWRSGPVPTDDGVAELTFTESLAGSQTVTARIVSPGCVGAASDSITHDWWIPDIALSTEDTPELGEELTYTATVSHDGDGIEGVDLDFAVANVNGAVPDLSGSGTTDGDGQASFGWVRDEAGELAPDLDAERLLVREDVAGTSSIEPVTAGALVWWEREQTDSLVLTVEQSSVRSRVGEATTLTATYSREDADGVLQPVEGLEITIDGEVLVTDENGQVTYDWEASAPTFEVFSFNWDDDGEAPLEAETAVLHQWWAPNLVMTPEDSVSPTATTFGAAAVASLAGEPVGGENVEFLVDPTAPGPPEIEDEVITGPDGRAVLTWSRSAPTVDQVTASIELPNEDVVAAQVAHGWVAPAARPSMTLRQSSSVSRAGAPVTLTAQIAGGAAEEGFGEAWEVRFSGTGEAWPPVAVLTDGSGTARTVVSSDIAVAERIVATASVVGCVDLVAPSTGHRWLIPALTLAPLDATADTDAPFALTAILALDGTPLAGRPLAFSVDAAGGSAGDFDVQRSTDAQGRVTIEWQRSAPTVDTVTVREVTPFVAAQQSTAVSWVGAAPPAALTLTAGPDGTSGPVGSSFSVQAQASLGGNPASGVDITVDADLPGADPIQLSEDSNDAGNADFTWSRAIAGVDDVTVTATFGGQTVSVPLERTWTVVTTPPVTVDPGPDPPVPVPVPDPEPPDPPDEPDEPVEPTEPDEPTPPPDIQDEDEPPTEPPTKPAVLEAGNGTGQPGGDLLLAGGGCQPGAQVEIRVGDVAVGTVTAADDGSYTLRTAVPDVPLGRYVVTSSCGDVTAEVLLDLVRPQESNEAKAAGVTTTGTVLLFFVLVGNALVRGLSTRIT